MALPLLSGRIVPPHSSEGTERWQCPSAGSHPVPQQAGTVGVSRAQVTASQVRSNRAVPASSIRTGKLLLPVLESFPPCQGHAVSLYKAAPSQLPQLPVPAKRYLSLTLDSGLMLFQKVLPCCAFGLHYLICSNQPPSRCRHC